MSTVEKDVLGIGNAIVDVFSSCGDEFIKENGLVKGAMTLVDQEEASKLYESMVETKESSGGSAANTIAGVASMGGQASFIGKIRNDKLGTAFTRDIHSLGVQFDTTVATSGASTARCLVFVTPDAQRTMATYLGACVNLVPDDVDSASIIGAKITYLEGYLWDPPEAKLAFRKAARLAHDNDREIALSLSDPFCVDRYRSEFLEFTSTEVDILFANEDEVTSLYRVKTLKEAILEVRKHCETAVITLGEKGSLIVRGDAVYDIAAISPEGVVDTTGAGDLYAAGFLYGHTHGCDYPTCGLYGSRAAAEVISHYGARPERSLKDLMVG